MAASPYTDALDKNPANFQPLTPPSFLERAAYVYPEHTAIIHGPLRRSYRDFYARSKKLASALAKRGIGKGDTVAVMLANTPAMLECHYGVLTRSRRSESVDHRSRIRQDHQPCARRMQSASDDHRL